MGCPGEGCECQLYFATDASISHTRLSIWILREAAGQANDRQQPSPLLTVDRSRPGAWKSWPFKEKRASGSTSSSAPQSSAHSSGPQTKAVAINRKPNHDARGQLSLMTTTSSPAVDRFPCLTGPAGGTTRYMKWFAFTQHAGCTSDVPTFPARQRFTFAQLNQVQLGAGSFPTPT